MASPHTAMDRSVRTLGGRLLTSETLALDGHPARDAGATMARLFPTFQMP